MSDDLESYWAEIRVPPLPRPPEPEPAPRPLGELLVMEALASSEVFWLGLMEDEHTEAWMPRIPVKPQATDSPEALLFDATFPVVTAGHIQVRFFALWATSEGGEPLLVAACDNRPDGITAGVGDTLNLKYTLYMGL